jgi:hypothetical protein
MAILPKVMGSERITKKVEPFSPGVPYRGFGLIDGQLQFGHHTSRPLQSRVRMPTAQNGKVIRIGATRTEGRSACQFIKANEETNCDFCGPHWPCIWRDSDCTQVGKFGPEHHAGWISLSQLSSVQQSYAMLHLYLSGRDCGGGHVKGRECSVVLTHAMHFYFSCPVSGGVGSGASGFGAASKVLLRRLRSSSRCNTTK